MYFSAFSRAQSDVLGAYSPDKGMAQDYALGPGIKLLNQYFGYPKY